MEDRTAAAAKLIVTLDGTLESAEKTAEGLGKIRAGVRKEIDMLMKELNVIDGFIEYVLTKRNELAHDIKPQLGTKLVMTNKQERVEAVIDAAIEVVEDGIPIFGIEDIKEQLEKTRIDLGVAFPPAVVATILAADKRFKKTSAGLYEYIGRKQRGRKSK